MVEIEVLSPEDKVPPGVRIGIKHFLTPPKSPEVASFLNQVEDVHSLIKITKEGETYNVQRIEDFKIINAEHFYTLRLQGEKLCHLTTVLGF